MQRLDLITDGTQEGTIFEFKRGVRGVRDVDTALMQLARYAAAAPGTNLVLVLPDVGVREERLRREWDEFSRVVRPAIIRRMRIVGESDGRYFGIPADPDEQLKKVISAHIAEPRKSPARSDRVRQADFWFFTILKILMNRFVGSGEPMRIIDLASAAGCTYATVRRVLESLGGIVERMSDRSVRLRWFPKPEFARMAAVAPRVRRTMRFVDRSATPRTAEQHLKRLSTLRIDDVAIGGIAAARHYARDLDIVGTPRLDLSLGSAWRNVDDAATRLAQRIDPALQAATDPLAQPVLVIHQVPHAIDLFVRGERHVYADLIECLLDLYEARLEGPARDLLQAITVGYVR